MGVRVGPLRRLTAKELMLSNCTLVVLEKTLEGPLDCKEIKPVNPKEINREYSLEGLVLKLKLQYFNHSLVKTLMLGKIESRRRRGKQRIRWLNGNTDLLGYDFEQTQGDSEGQGSLACCSSWGRKESDKT